MITFICCSIKPSYAENLEKNIKETLGDMPFEFIAFDNREAKLGMCEVYNNNAEKSKYECLCFLHEDVKFLTNGWGHEIVRKLQEEDCGCIGFAGSVIKMSHPSGWYLNNQNTRHHYRQLYVNVDKKPSNKRRNPDGGDYSEVITLDGMALFVSKKVWSQHKFDQDNLRDFHCYDIDFTINLARSGYKNYVTNLLYLEHFSDGNFSERWRDDTLKLHDKWKEHLPLYASSLDKRYLKRYLPKAYYSSIKTVLKYDLYTGTPKKEILEHMKRNPLKLSSWKLIRLYSKYKSKYEM
ncbi:MAG: glycosyltransferase [Rikenellaceae bacterium]